MCVADHSRVRCCLFGLWPGVSEQSVLAAFVALFFPPLLLLLPLCRLLPAVVLEGGWVFSSPAPLPAKGLARHYRTGLVGWRSCSRPIALSNLSHGGPTTRGGGGGGNGSDEGVDVYGWNTEFPVPLDRCHTSRGRIPAPVLIDWCAHGRTGRSRGGRSVSASAVCFLRSTPSRPSLPVILPGPPTHGKIQPEPRHHALPPSIAWSTSPLDRSDAQPAPFFSTIYANSVPGGRTPLHCLPVPSQSSTAATTICSSPLVHGGCSHYWSCAIDGRWNLLRLVHRWAWNRPRLVPGNPLWCNGSHCQTSRLSDASRPVITYEIVVSLLSQSAQIVCLPAASPLRTLTGVQEVVPQRNS